MPQFEKYRRGSVVTADSPAVTIQKRGTLSINRVGHEGMGSPAFVTLHFDREAQVIGVQAAPPTDKDKYAIRKQGNSASYIVAASGFLQFYGLPVGESRRYDAAVIDGMLQIDTRQEPQPVAVGRRRRKPLPAQT